MTDEPGMVLDIVDAEARIQNLLEAVEPMLGSSVVTLEKVQVLRYGAPDPAGCDDATAAPPDVGRDVDERR